MKTENIFNLTFFYYPFYYILSNEQSPLYLILKKTKV